MLFQRFNNFLKNELHVEYPIPSDCLLRYTGTSPDINTLTLNSSMHTLPNSCPFLNYYFIIIATQIYAQTCTHVCMQVYIHVWKPFIIPCMCMCPKTTRKMVLENTIQSHWDNSQTEVPSSQIILAHVKLKKLVVTVKYLFFLRLFLFYFDFTSKFRLKGKSNQYTSQRTFSTCSKHNWFVL